MLAASTLEAMSVNGSTMPDTMPDLGLLNEELEASQLLDVQEELEDGELESSVDEGILDEPEPFVCSICKADLVGTEPYDKYIKKSYECMTDDQHNYCNPCAYKSMMNTKYCPSGKRCRYPGGAAPWSWHRDVLIECSITYVMENFGDIETFQCPACALHCATREDLGVHQLACEPPTKKTRNFLQ